MYHSSTADQVPDAPNRPAGLAGWQKLTCVAHCLVVKEPRHCYPRQRANARAGEATPIVPLPPLSSRWSQGPLASVIGREAPPLYTPLCWSTFPAARSRRSSSEGPPAPCPRPRASANRRTLLGGADGSSPYGSSLVLAPGFESYSASNPSARWSRPAGGTASYGPGAPAPGRRVRAYRRAL